MQNDGWQCESWLCQAKVAVARESCFARENVKNRFLRAALVTTHRNYCTKIHITLLDVGQVLKVSILRGSCFVVCFCSLSLPLHGRRVAPVGLAMPRRVIANANGEWGVAPKSASLRCMFLSAENFLRKL
jgi:hypothetical protein